MCVAVAAVVSLYMFKTPRIVIVYSVLSLWGSLDPPRVTSAQKRLADKQTQNARIATSEGLRHAQCAYTRLCDTSGSSRIDYFHTIHWMD